MEVDKAEKPIEQAKFIFIFCSSAPDFTVGAHRGARTHDHKVKSIALYQLSQTGL